VLFVSSGNHDNGTNIIVKNQGNSLINNGIDLDYFSIEGKGALGYLRNIPKLCRHLKNGSYHLVHAHYSKSAIFASLATRMPIIVSLMGSDAKDKYIWKYLTKILSRNKWKYTIVKSEKMKTELGLPSVQIIPNGVDFQKFNYINKHTAQKRAKFDPAYKHILFISKPNRKEKNFWLADSAVKSLNIKRLRLKIVDGVSHNLISTYMNASDVLLLTSLWEGSPNVIKEAMACNCPIVSTDVGDVRQIIGNSDGCYICSYDPGDVANKIKIALDFGKRTNGREKIKHLDSNIIAKNMIQLYESVLKSN